VSASALFRRRGRARARCCRWWRRCRSGYRWNRGNPGEFSL
jgi:hypothetical protein